MKILNVTDDFIEVNVEAVDLNYGRIPTEIISHMESVICTVKVPRKINNYPTWVKKFVNGCNHTYLIKRNSTKIYHKIYMTEISTVPNIPCYVLTTLTIYSTTSDRSSSIAVDLYTYHSLWDIEDIKKPKHIMPHGTEPTKTIKLTKREKRVFTLIDSIIRDFITMSSTNGYGTSVISENAYTFRKDLVVNIIHTILTDAQSDCENFLNH